MIGKAALAFAMMAAGVAAPLPLTEDDIPDRRYTIVADIAVDLPDRSPAARLSHAFADQCARVSAALEGAP